ncbi:uroporphyrinogen decarboxylase, partial [Clostridium perfringens]|nr:uroporphyrinogen decarboxylase [Clostridium perfringens]
ELWFMLMDKLGDMVITYVRSQIKNGGKAFQLFDSWAGSLSPRDFQTYVLPTIERIYASLSDLNVPNIYFPGVSSGELLPLLHQVKASVIGLDWRVSIEEGRRRLGDQFAVQGNMDPYLLTGPMDN